MSKFTVFSKITIVLFLLHSINSGNNNQLPLETVLLGKFDQTNPSCDCWAYDWVNGSQANAITNGSQEIVVAILDTGVDYRYPEIQAALWKRPSNSSEFGWNFVENNAIPFDNVSHGTFIASLIIGLGANSVNDSGKTLPGIAPNVRIMPLRILAQERGDSGESIEAFVNAVRYAVDNGARVISMSISWDDFPVSVHEVLNWAYFKGVLIVGVTGNKADEKIDITDLGKLPEVIAVGASTQKGEKTNFSQYGPSTEILAPGENITGADLLNAGRVSALSVNGSSYYSVPLEYSQTTTSPVQSSIVYVGLARNEDLEGLDISGKIALIRRGEIFFREKVANVHQKGAIGAIIANNQSGLFSGTLIEPSAIPAIAISGEDGDTLIDSVAKSILSLGIVEVRPSNLSIGSGTSFAAPLVSATAALMFSVNPELSNLEARLILQRTASDIYDQGRDYLSGFGILNSSYAVEAAKDDSPPIANISNIPDGENTIISVNAYDDIGVFKLDFAYQGTDGNLIRNITNFKSRTNHFLQEYFVPFPNGLFSYYVAIEDIRGLRFLSKEGNI
ncbi:MAG TPA: S8 family serine peptidase, partial [Candidatus Hodarchaeales archaeon]|nr:S8 family serine peptidase [Candidatus Hodarchaeales archaeon]